MGVQAPPELLGIHSNMPAVLRPRAGVAPAGRHSAPDGYYRPRTRAYEQASFLYTKGIGYLHPQTLYGIADSPAGLAAWILDHDAQSYLDITSAFVDGPPVGSLTADEVLDNITLTWLTDAGSPRSSLPRERVWLLQRRIARVPRKILWLPASWAERARINLIYYNEVDQEQFAACRAPNCSQKRSARRSGRCGSATMFERLHMPPFAGAAEWLDLAPPCAATVRCW